MLPSVLMLTSTTKEQVPSREKAVRDRSTVLLSRAKSVQPPLDV